MSCFHDRWQMLVQALQPSTYKLLRLVAYTIIIILFLAGSALYFQKIYKSPYARTDTSNLTEGSLPSDHFTNPFAIPIFDSLVGMLMGLLLYCCSDSNEQRIRRNQSVPWTQFTKLSIISSFVLILTPITTMMTSFITMSLVTSCQLIVIVLLAIFFSESSSHFRVQKRQIIIAGILCIGVIIYNVFDYSKKDGQDKPLTLLSGSLLFSILLIASFKPQVLAQIRDKYSPSPSYIYLQVCKYSLVILLVISAATTHLWQMCVFIWHHDNLMLDLFIQSFLHGVAAVISFRVSLQYKQHILPIISTVRKLLSSLLSAYVFGHSLNKYQYLGLGLVFSALLVNIYMSIKRRRSDNQQQAQLDFEPETTEQAPDQFKK